MKNSTMTEKGQRIIFDELVKEFESTYQVFVGTSHHRRTFAFKKRHQESGKKFWEEFQKICLEIDKRSITASPDPCYISSKARITSLYEQYVKELSEIPDRTPSREEDTLTAGQRFHLKQKTRMDALQRSIEDVQRKVAAGELFQFAYCKLKSSMIQTNWERIQIANEECEVDRDDLPLEYEGAITDLELAVEEVLLTLHQGMERRITDNPVEGLKLPRMTIPKYSGDYFKWISFRDLFKAMVIDNASLTNAQRMQMLKMNLKDEAERLIDDLSVSDANFDSAWQRLLERYDNRRVVVGKHLHKLSTQQAIKSEAKALKKLLDTTDQTLLALKNLNRPVESWDDWIVFMIAQKFSDDIRKDWERKIGNATELPTWTQLKIFMEEEFRMLEGIEQNHRRIVPEQKFTEKSKPAAIKAYQASVDKDTNSDQCAACEGSHGLFSCAKFKEMEPRSRWELAKRQKLCFSCLKKHKDTLKCEKKKPCKKCDRQHSTWLHEDREKGQAVTSAVGIISNAYGALQTKQVLLATALVTVIDKYGRGIVLRALIDQGSQGSMITTRAAAALRLDQVSTHDHIDGLGGNKLQRLKYSEVLVQSRYASEISVTVTCYILDTVTKDLPDADFEIKHWSHLKGLRLADPTFNRVGKVDLLLGNDVIGDLLLPGFQRGGKGSPLAQETSLGWIVSGPINARALTREINCSVATTSSEDDLSKFWELEELNPKRKMTPDEMKCEEFYQRTHKREPNGTFTVKIPFKDDGLGPQRLGQSRNQSLSRFFQLEKRLVKDEALRKEYVAVMEEYIELGHMRPVDHLPDSAKKYHIPHHAVLKPDSLTTKLRVVFDASAKTTTGYSLNECMHTGGKQQNDLFEILSKWRKNKIVFKADITKMYRMISLDEEDQQYHTVFWRKDVNEQIREYQLTTVTFGTAAAPFMATRTLNEIAAVNEATYPMAAETIREDFYVDDLISGQDDIKSALKAKDELLTVLPAAGMQLRKWSSNSDELLRSLPMEMTEKSLQSFEDGDSTKALGLQWNPRTDKFSFSIRLDKKESVLTKRRLLSEASRIFDPLGWLAPVVLHPKLIMQDIWNLKVDWDEEVPKEIASVWKQFSKELPELAKIEIDRWLSCEPNDELQLHGFCDASEKAYSAVVYLRIQKPGRVEVRLVASKTRAAPSKTKTTIPRLELCGAVLLSNLLVTVNDTLKMGNLDTVAWSDSMVALGWLRKDPNNWKTFVANRVSEIQSTKVKNWRYVPSEENPADCASRGLMPGELKNHHLWWSGPEWLKKEEIEWPVVETTDTEVEQRKIAVNVARVERQELLLEPSSWFKTVRIMAYVRRMKYRPTHGPTLTVEELEAAKKILYRQCQGEEFSEEISRLKNKEPISTKSKLIQLNPFLDEDGILRVGGRLRHAPIAYNNKHPIILPSGHKTTRAIVHQMHLDTLHGGPQLMVNLLRKNIWIINGKKMATAEVKSCLNCRRFDAKIVQPMMGDLPKERLKLERSFKVVGVDYCGPIEVRTSRLRNAKIVKGYIALFICFGTKAVHLELVSEMTTAAFTAALNRFIARRGLCSRIYSDNGSNFVGASRILVDQERQFLHERNKELAITATTRGIEWHFIPPGAPNFGGLWERGVRSMKDHLKRTLKLCRLTYEEYGTVLCQIEACLNSRPLSPLTSDPEELNALTPGHFLIGEALLAPPQPMVADNRATLINRWQHLQLLQQHFWQRWNREYLTLLQQRHKWHDGTTKLRVGDVVLVKDERLTPRNWAMGRITDLHPGADGKVRVATLRVSTGEVKRPVSKLCLLYSEDPDETDDGELEHGKHETQVGVEVEEHDLGPEDRQRERASMQQPVVAEEPLEAEVEEHDLGPTDRQQELAAMSQPVIVDNEVEEIVSDQEKAEDRESEPVGGTRRQYNLRPRTPNQVLLLMATIWMVLCVGGGIASATNPIEIRPFDHNAGMYFEDLGRAEIIRSDWHIFLRFNLNRYFQECGRIDKLTGQLDTVCKEAMTKEATGSCKELITLLKHAMVDIHVGNELMKPDSENGFGRTRRAAPLNGVGWIGHELFGLMDSTEADKIEKHFAILETDASYQLQLIKNQTTIVESTVNLMQKSQQAMKANYAVISDAIANIQNGAGQVEKELQIVALSMYALAAAQKLHETQGRILEILTGLHQGHVNSQLFSPAQFKEQLKIITNNLPTGSMLPSIAQQDIKLLYKIIKGSARSTGDNIIVEIILPLVDADEFQAIKAVPIPVKYQNAMVTIIPESEYLMMNLKRDAFYQVTEKEFHTCMKPGPRMLICHLAGPRFTAQSERSQCERDMLVKDDYINSHCRFAMTKEEDFWINLSARNHWIFGTKQSLTLNVVCGRERTATRIQGLGLLIVAPGCEVNQPEMSIIANLDKQSTGEFNYHPVMNLSEIVIKGHWPTEMSKLNLTLNYTSHFNELIEQIETLKKNSHRMTTVQHYSHGVYGMLICVIVIACFICYMQREKIKRKSVEWYASMAATATGDVNKNQLENGDQDEQNNGRPEENSVGSSGSSSGAMFWHEGGECPKRT